jgi:hypothetical protein
MSYAGFVFQHPVKRLVAQLQSAMATPDTGQVVLWTLKAPTAAELVSLLATLGEQGATVQIIDGLLPSHSKNDHCLHQTSP